MADRPGIYNLLHHSLCSGREWKSTSLIMKTATLTLTFLSTPSSVQFADARVRDNITLRHKHQSLDKDIICQFLPHYTLY